MDVLETGEMKSLYEDSQQVHMSPVFSPDGRWMVYNSGEDIGLQDVFVEPFPPNGARRKISPDLGFWPMWSRDGSELFYRPAVGPAQTGITLRVVDVATEPEFTFSNERTLPVGNFVANMGYRDYDITPDDKKLLMVFPEGATDSSMPTTERIQVVLNWFEELKERVPIER